MTATYAGSADLGQALPAHVADGTRQPLAAHGADCARRQPLPVTSAITTSTGPLTAVENYLKEQHQWGSWHNILNNTTSTRPKRCGGPTFQSLAALKQTTVVTPGFHTCIICLPCSFVAGDGEEFAVSATATSPEEAGEAACLCAFATLLVKDASKVLLRQTHWRCAVSEVVAMISTITGDMRQPLTAHVADGTRPSSQSGCANEKDVLDLLRAILQNEGGIADPSRLRLDEMLDHALTLCAKPYLRLDEMLMRGTLRQFLQAHSEEFEVLPHGPHFEGFRFRLRPHSQAAPAAVGVVPGSASMHSSCAPGSASASTIMEPREDHTSESAIPPARQAPPQKRRKPPKRQALLARTGDTDLDMAVGDSTSVPVTGSTSVPVTGSTSAPVTDSAPVPVTGRSLRETELRKQLFDSKLKQLRAKALDEQASRQMAIEDTASRDIEESSFGSLSDGVVLQTDRADEALQTASEVCEDVAAAAMSARMAGEVWPASLQAAAFESVRGEALKEMQEMKEAGLEHCRWRDLGVSHPCPQLEDKLLKIKLEE